MMLLDDAVNRRQSQPGAFADFLGGEKRIKDAGQELRCNAATGVGNGDTNIWTGPDFRVFMGVVGGDGNGSNRDYALDKCWPLCDI